VLATGFKECCAGSANQQVEGVLLEAEWEFYFPVQVAGCEWLRRDARVDPW